MTIYCVMSDNPRTDLDNVVFATKDRAKAEDFARRYEFLRWNGEPSIEELDIDEDD